MVTPHIVEDEPHLSTNDEMKLATTEAARSAARRLLLGALLPGGGLRGENLCRTLPPGRAAVARGEASAPQVESPARPAQGQRARRRRLGARRRRERRPRHRAGRSARWSSAASPCAATPELGTETRVERFAPKQGGHRLQRAPCGGHHASVGDPLTSSPTADTVRTPVHISWPRRTTAWATSSVRHGARRHRRPEGAARHAVAPARRARAAARVRVTARDSVRRRSRIQVRAAGSAATSPSARHARLRFDPPVGRVDTVIQLAIPEAAAGQLRLRAAWVLTEAADSASTASPCWWLLPAALRPRARPSPSRSSARRAERGRLRRGHRDRQRQHAGGAGRRLARPDPPSRPRAPTSLTVLSLVSSRRTGRTTFRFLAGAAGVPEPTDSLGARWR